MKNKTRKPITTLFGVVVWRIVGFVFASSLAAQALVVNVDLNASGDPNQPANRRGIAFTGQGAVSDSGNNLWNIVHAGESASSLRSSNGTPTALNLTISGGGVFVDTDPNDNDLLRDYFFGETTTTIYGLEPDTSYTLYVYAVGDTQGQGSNITVGFGPGLETQNYLQQQSQTLSTSGNNTPAQYSQGGNYQVFTATSSPNGRLIIRSSNFINGLQIVGVAPVKDTQFVHPGLSHKLSDLERIRAQIEAKEDPWYSSYVEMASLDQASFDYEIRGFEDTHPNFGQFVVFRNSVNGFRSNFRSWESDSRAAYYNALQWSITGDVRHAEKAVEILNVWSQLEYVQHTGTQSLTSCLSYIMIEAAEIMKSTYEGWSDADVQAFGEMLVYPGYSTTSVPNNLNEVGTWYWRAYRGDSNRAGNQDICGWRTLMAIGVFLDNPIIYDRGLRYIRGLTHRPDDLPYDAGPRVNVGAPFATTGFRESYNNQQLSTIPDHGFNGTLLNYIYENGQCEESSRDQGHTLFGTGMLAMIGEIAWNQGFDFYGAVDSRVLLGLEYSLRYNLSFLQSFPDQPEPWMPSLASGEFIDRFDATHRTRSLAINPYVDTGTQTLFGNLTRGNVSAEHIWELPVAHYIGRGIKTEEEAKWSLRTRDYVIEDTGQFESAPGGQAYVGYGGMSFRRPEQCHGDPVSGYSSEGLPIYKMPEIPGIIEAENFDHFVTSGQGRTYNDQSTGNSGGEYRLDEDVDLTACSDTTGGFAVTDITNNEWLSYTVNVLHPGNYSLAIRYAGNSAGRVRFAFDGNKATGDVTLPGTNNSNSWETYTVASNVPLREGAQSLQLFFSGSPNQLDLNQIIITREDVITTRIEAEDFDGVNGITVRNAQTASGNQHLGNIASGDWVRYDDVSLEEGSTLRLGIGRPANRPPGRVEARLNSPTGDIVAVHHLTDTGGWESFESFDLKLTSVSGQQDLYLVFENNGASSSDDLCNLDWIELEVPDGSDFLDFTRIEAEDYASQNGINTESTTDAGGGLNVGNISDGDWLRYNNIEFGNSTQIRLRLARPQGRPPGLVELRLDSPTGTVIGSRRINTTGGWQNWITRDVEVDPTVNGNHDLYIVFSELGTNVSGGAMVNFNWFEIATPEPPTSGLDGRIEAENFLSQNGTQLENTGDIGGGQNVSHISNGDWLFYGEFPLVENTIAHVRLAQPPGRPPGVIEFRLDSPTGPVIGSQNVINTGNWQVYETLSVSIDSTITGIYPLYITFRTTNGDNTSFVNFNWFELETQISGTQDSDGDGVENSQDAFPNDPSESADSDGDGVGDNQDVFPNDPNESADSDGDGVGDNSDSAPNNPLIPSVTGNNFVQLRKRNANNFAMQANGQPFNGQNVHLWNSNPNDSFQQWEEIDRGQGFYTYQLAGTNFCLDGGNGGAIEQNVYLWTTQANNQNQHWRKVLIFGNIYRLEKRNSTGFSIDGDNGGSIGQNVYLWTSNSGNQNQHWIIE